MLPNHSFSVLPTQGYCRINHYWTAIFTGRKLNVIASGCTAQRLIQFC
jgi:hypothetical protein